MGTSTVHGSEADVCGLSGGGIPYPGGCAREYHLDLIYLIQDLNRVIERDETPVDPSG